MVITHHFLEIMYTLLTATIDDYIKWCLVVIYLIYSSSAMLLSIHIDELP